MKMILKQIFCWICGAITTQNLTYIPECCCVCTSVAKSTPKPKSSQRKRETRHVLPRNLMFTPSSTPVLSACRGGRAAAKIDVKVRLEFPPHYSFSLHVCTLIHNCRWGVDHQKMKWLANFKESHNFHHKLTIGLGRQDLTAGLNVIK